MILRYLWILKIKEKLKEKKNQVNIIIRTDFFFKNNSAENIVKQQQQHQQHQQQPVFDIYVSYWGFFLLNNEFIWAIWSRKWKYLKKKKQTNKTKTKEKKNNKTKENNTKKTNLK